MKVYDFYSGIGGLHMALKIALSSAATESESEGASPHTAVHVIKAFDVNSNANKVYLHNHGVAPSLRSIEALQPKEVAGADIWLMSPPCQPYTRIGKGLDMADARARSFLNLIALLERMENPPRFVFVENVKNFEQSATRARLVSVLRARGYRIREYLLSPTQLGIPNTRLRYYLAAARVAGKGKEACASGETDDCQESVPASPPATQFPPIQSSIPLVLASGTHASGRYPNRIGAYIVQGTLPEERLQDTLLREGTLKRAGNFRFDVVTKASTTSTTFAKGYGVKGHFRGSGPVLLLTEDLIPAEKDHHLADAAPSEPEGSHAQSSPHKSNALPATKRHKEKESQSVSTTATATTNMTSSTTTTTSSLVSEIMETEAVSSEHARGRALADASCRFRTIDPQEHVRLFTREEMLALQGYPPSFTFPGGKAALTEKQARGLVGNSVNVIVIAHLLAHLLSPAFLSVTE